MQRQQRILGHERPEDQHGEQDQVRQRADHDEKRDAHVKGADFLETNRYPTITFVSKKITPAGKNRWKIVGDLTLHGVTKEATLDVESAGVEAKDPWGNLRTGAEATEVIKRSDYGLKFNAPLETGGVLVGEALEIAISIEAVNAQVAAA